VLQLIAVPKAQIRNPLFWDVFKEIPVSDDRKKVTEILYSWHVQMAYIFVRDDFY